MTIVDGDVFLIESRRSLRKRERMVEKLTTDIERTKEVYGHLPWSVNVENIIEIARDCGSPEGDRIVFALGITEDVHVIADVIAGWVVYWDGEFFDRRDTERVMNRLKGD